MLTLILCILCNQDLALNNLSITLLLEWLNLHPFIALTMIFDIGIGIGLFANLITSIILSFDDSHYQLCDCDEDCECDYEESNCKECFCKH